MGKNVTERHMKQFLANNIAKVIKCEMSNGVRVVLLSLKVLLKKNHFNTKVNTSIALTLSK